MSVLSSLFCPLCRNLITSLFVFTCSKTFLKSSCVFSSKQPLPFQVMKMLLLLKINKNFKVKISHPEVRVHHSPHCLRFVQFAGLVWKTVDPSLAKRKLFYYLQQQRYLVRIS